MSRQEDFKQKATEYNNNVNMHLDFYNGAEYGHQYAKKMIEDYLLCVELSNFFPTLSDEDADKGKEALTKAIKEFLDEI